MPALRRATKTTVDYSETLPQIPAANVIGNTLRRMRVAIMTGQLAPGQKLIEADLCRDFSVSRASMRETLRLLQAELLIDSTPHRGASVVQLNGKDIDDIHDIWSLLTGAAVYRFSGKVDANDLSKLRAAIARLGAAMARNDVLGQLAASNSFFGHILDRCDNQTLVGTVSALVSRVNFLRAQALHQPDTGARAVNELEDIVAALAGGKPGMARQAARAHIRSACAAAKQATGVPVRRLGPIRKKAALSTSELP